MLQKLFIFVTYAHYKSARFVPTLILISINVKTCLKKDEIRTNIQASVAVTSVMKKAHIWCQCWGRVGSSLLTPWQNNLE